MADLTHRVDPHDLAEWMDEPCSYEDFRRCVLDLGQVNRLTLAYRPTLHFLDRILAKHPPTHPLRIVDVGSGGGDMLRRIERWAHHRRVAVQLTGIDLNPHAARAAQEFTPTTSAIEFITGDAFSYDQPIDIVLSSLFTHHLATPEIIHFLAWSDATARLGWFINDLAREDLPYRLFGPWARIMRWHRFVVHDGPVSFRRAFRESDWLRMLSAAGVNGATLKRWTPARLCVEHLKETIAPAPRQTSK
jgi:SAM-dependent methyltransferase